MKRKVSIITEKKRSRGHSARKMWKVVGSHVKTEELS